jgi:uncharacterized membrane protein
MVKIGFLFCLLGLLLLANTCSASGLTLSVVAENGTIYVEPGQTISYIATVSDGEITSADLAEDVRFSINRTHQDSYLNPDWNYAFNPSEVRLENETDSKSSILTLDVPENTIPGTYSHTVQVSALNEYDKMIEGYTGRITVEVVNTDVTNVPEFPSIALPVAAVLGLVFVFGHKKE